MWTPRLLRTATAAILGLTITLPSCASDLTVSTVGPKRSRGDHARSGRNGVRQPRPSGRHSSHGHGEGLRPWPSQRGVRRELPRLSFHQREHRKYRWLHVDVARRTPRRGPGPSGWLVRTKPRGRLLWNHGSGVRHPGIVGNRHFQCQLQAECWDSNRLPGSLHHEHPRLVPKTLSRVAKTPAAWRRASHVTLGVALVASVAFGFHAWRSRPTAPLTRSPAGRPLRWLQPEIVIQPFASRGGIAGADRRGRPECG